MSATVEEMFTDLPTVSNALMSDIICAVQGFVDSSNPGLSVKETLQQVYNLFQSNIILFNSGNPNGFVEGSTYQFCWDTVNDILWLCTTSGTSSTAVWTRANINSGYTTTATSGGTTTLTIGSFYWQFFTGSSNQTVVMPVTSTLSEGMTWSIVNNSSGTVTVESSGANTIVTLSAGQRALVTCILNSGTSASSWYAAMTGSGGGVTSITGTAHQVIASASTGAVTLSAPQDIDTISSPTFAGLTLSSPLTQANGGTQNSTPLTNGQLWIGNTGNPPSRATLTAGSGVSITNAAGSISISGTAASIGWNVVTTNTSMIAENGYITNSGSLITLTLPTTAVVGSAIAVTGLGSGGWTIAQNSSQNIKIGSSTSTTGVGGSISSTNSEDSLYLVCIVTDTTWTTLGAPQGNLTIV